MKWLKTNLLIFTLLLVLSCSNEKEDFLAYYKNNDSSYDELFRKNRENLSRDFPFYVLNNNSILLKSPEKKMSSSSNLNLKFGDILYPVTPIKSKDNFFYVKTINNKYGWIYSNNGISIDYTIDNKLYYFSDDRDNYYNKDFYLQRYKKSDGNPKPIDKIILLKNIIPMLIGDYKTPAWFYPNNYKLALDLATFAVENAKDQDTMFYAATMTGPWRVNEYVISMNLLADSYSKLGYYKEAISTHEKLMRSFFWDRSGNTPVGGLNSVVKLEKIYLDMLKNEKKDSKNYKRISKELIDTILIIDRNINYFTVMDNEWHATAAEWLLDILKKNTTTEEFIYFCNTLMKKTSSVAYSDFIEVYKALTLYETGEKEKALSLLSQIKPRHHFKRLLKINDWISDKGIIPEEILYKYRF